MIHLNFVQADPDAGKHPRLLRNVRLLELMGNKLEGPSEKTELVNSTSGIQGLKAQLEGSEINKDTPKLETEKKKEDKENTEEEKTLVENTKKDVYVDYIRSGPPDGGLSKTMWYISLPIMAPMWLTIPDPQSPKTKRFFPLAFIVSILWIAVFSYFMVWWAGIVGETIGISDAGRAGKTDNPTHCSANNRLQLRHEFQMSQLIEKYGFVKELRSTFGHPKGALSELNSDLRTPLARFLLEQSGSNFAHRPDCIL